MHTHQPDLPRIDERRHRRVLCLREWANGLIALDNRLPQLARQRVRTRIPEEGRQIIGAPAISAYLKVRQGDVIGSGEMVFEPVKIAADHPIGVRCRDQIRDLRAYALGGGLDDNNSAINLAQEWPDALERIIEQKRKIKVVSWKIRGE